jgi:hypothetical protein
VEIVPISRTVGQERIVDEFVYRCTHSIPMEWLLPGVPPTGRRMEIPTVVIITFEDGKMKSERLYWDQASVLVQLGLLDPAGLPVAGIEVAPQGPRSGGRAVEPLNEAADRRRLAVTGRTKRCSRPGRHDGLSRYTVSPAGPAAERGRSHALLLHK